jgi:hypothetical protein
MAVYRSGELFWDTAEAAAPRWVLVVDGPPGGARRRLDPQDPSTPGSDVHVMLPTDICGTVDPQAHTHPVEVNS